MLNKVLIANRGEIAVRIIRACKELGISTVAVYSTIDKSALHTQLADESCCIGEPPPLESYLNMDVIIDTAKRVGADAIHPGYGFLAENPEFAKRCESAGVVFIGPTSKALSLVGDKVVSRNTMNKVGIPIIPGMHEVITSSYSKNIKELKEVASKVGYPVLVKASLGGGKGMRIVKNEKELENAISAGKREAMSAFGDDSVYLEKYIEKPHHVEFQVLADNFGNVVHVFERECSIQRRYQKVVEETPSQALTPELREKMGEVAKKVIKVAGYTNAGTVEFLLDENKNFYFLEVNARLQVEHPITELTTGVDLVKQQILIAGGEKLTLKQENLAQRGHAIEARIYAEDAETDFLPSPGKIHFLKEPQGPGVRVDSGIYSGCEVSPYYDPILSKLIVWAETREFARRRLVQALKGYVILGIKTTIPFLIDVIEHPKFIKTETTSSPWQEIGEWEMCSH
ncbi:MAG: acetyl-CoA carboxylase biotin carboxylase subunit [bacterium]|nr:acetyl-CoA carboxylase biotin carboxylase subunit [bacterium]